MLRAAAVFPVPLLYVVFISYSLIGAFAGKTGNSLFTVSAILVKAEIKNLKS